MPFDDTAGQSEARDSLLLAALMLVEAEEELARAKEGALNDSVCDCRRR